MVTPGTPPVPHVGGPILPPGAPTVLIGFMPAARVTDMCTCVGPPDAIAKGSPTVMINGLMAARMGDSTIHGGVIVMGCPTVLIGEGGGGGVGVSGGGGGGLAGLSDLANFVADAIEAGINKAMSGLDDAWSEIRELVPNPLETLKQAHYDQRDALNASLPSHEEATAPDSGWWLLPPEESVYHDNHIGKPELKYVHEDGREVVYDGDTHEVIKDPKYKGTYNYHPMMPREYYPDGTGGWMEKQVDGAGHLIQDVVPYWLLGNTRDE